MSLLRFFSLNPDSAMFDGFTRFRVGNTAQRLDVEFTYGTSDDLVDIITNNGTVVHNADPRDLTLSVSGALNGDKAEVRTHPIPYTPGNSQLMDSTGVLDLANIGGGVAEVFIRTKISGTVSETSYEQSTWENAKTGVNWNFSHILAIDFQSLKVGRVRWFLNQNGLPVTIKKVFNDNVRNTGYWQLPSIPMFWCLRSGGTYTYMEMGYGNHENAIGLRYKITTNANATMKAICGTVKSEGGLDLQNMQGFNRGVDMGVTKKIVAATLIPLISIKPRATFKTFDNLSLIIPKSYTVETDNAIRLVILHGATLTGASFTNVNTNKSAVEFDVAATAVSGGTMVHPDYAGSGRNNVSNHDGILGKTILWNRQGSENGILTIAAQRTSNTSASVLAGFGWTEIR